MREKGWQHSFIGSTAKIAGLAGSFLFWGANQPPHHCASVTHCTNFYGRNGEGNRQEIYNFYALCFPPITKY